MNSQHEKVSYMNRLQAKFIDFCVENGIHIVNRPNMSFYLPDLGLSIITKDNKQAKNIKTTEYASDVMIISPKTYINSKKLILQKANKI